MLMHRYAAKVTENQGRRPDPLCMFLLTGYPPGWLLI